jgi:hypothetical protein
MNRNRRFRIFIRDYAHAFLKDWVARVADEYCIVDRNTMLPHSGPCTLGSGQTLIVYFHRIA